MIPLSPPWYKSRLAALGVLAAVAAGGAAPGPDKRADTWANPTPESALREMSTDRPDATESPFTVDAGHVQVELDLANFTRNRLDGVRTTEWGVAPFNLRFGLRHDFEVGVFVAPFVRGTEEPRGGPKTAASGLGDTTLRAKWNFWGNDGGESAFGLIADLKLPTAARGFGSDKVEGALTLPIALSLAGGWDFGAMTSLGATHDGDGYRALWGNTATLSHDLGENTGGYCEFTSEIGDGPHACTLNVGLTWRLDRHRQFDVGANFGVSRTAPDLTLFAGFSRRF